MEMTTTGAVLGPSQNHRPGGNAKPVNSLLAKPFYGDCLSSSMVPA